MTTKTKPLMIPVEVVLEGAEIPSYSYLAKRLNAAMETRGGGYIPADVIVLSPLQAMIYAIPIGDPPGVNTASFYGVDQSTSRPDELAAWVNEMTDNLRSVGRVVMRHYIFFGGAILWTYEVGGGRPIDPKPFEDVFAAPAAGRGSDRPGQAATAPEAKETTADRPGDDFGATREAFLVKVRDVCNSLAEDGFVPDVVEELGSASAHLLASRMHQRAYELDAVATRAARLKRVLFALDAVYRVAGMTLSRLVHSRASVLEWGQT